MSPEEKSKKEKKKTGKLAESKIRKLRIEMNLSCFNCGKKENLAVIKRKNEEILLCEKCRENFLTPLPVKSHIPRGKTKGIKRFSDFGKIIKEKGEKARIKNYYQLLAELVMLYSEEEFLSYGVEISSQDGKLKFLLSKKERSVIAVFQKGEWLWI